MKKEVIKQIRDILEENGTDVYFPSQHKGECIKEYIVIKNDGSTDEYTVSAERPLYTVLHVFLFLLILCATQKLFFFCSLF